MSNTLIWVESYGGSGHLNLVLNIARELMDANQSVTIASSNLSKNSNASYNINRESILQEGIKILDMPVLADETGEMTENKIERRFDSKWHEERRKVLQDNIEDQKYDAIIVESWPFTRSPVYDIELTGLVDSAHVVGAKLYATIIDIPSISTHHGYQGFRRGVWGGDEQQCMRNIEEHGFEIITQGDGVLHPFSENYPEFGFIKNRVHELGYFVRNESQIKSNDLEYDQEKPVVSAVGGTFGYDAKSHLELSIKSKKYSGKLAENPWHIFVPKQATEQEFQELKDLASKEDPSGRIFVKRNNISYKDMVPEAALLIIKGAYNSTMESLLCNTPFVTVPIAKNEQLQRSKRYKETGIAPMLLTPETHTLLNKKVDDPSSFSAPFEPDTWGSTIEQSYDNRYVHKENMAKVNVGGLKNFANKIASDIECKPSVVDNKFSLTKAENFSSYNQVRSHSYKHSIKSAYPEAKAYILDWDETSIDNFGIADKTFEEVDVVMARRNCQKYNNWTLEDKRKGTAPYAPKDFLKGKYGTNGGDAYNLYEKIYMDLLEENAMENDGLEDFLRDCDEQQIPVAIVSNSPLHIIDAGRDILSKNRAHATDYFNNLMMIGSGAGLRSKPDTHMMEVAYGYLSEQYKAFHSEELDKNNIYSVGDDFQKDGRPSVKMGFNYISMRSKQNNQLDNMNTHLTVSDFNELRVYAQNFLNVENLDREF